MEIPTVEAMFFARIKLHTVLLPRGDCMDETVGKVAAFRDAAARTLRR